MDAWIKSAHDESRRGARHDLLIAVQLLRLGKIVGSLQVQPEARIGAEIPSEPDRRIRRDIARAAHDLGQAVGGNAEQLRQGPRRQAEQHEVFLAQDFAGMGL
jgi:hypothetical protein